MSLATTPAPARGWLTLQDVSEITGVPLSTIREHRRRGLLKATKPGGVWLVRPEWFDEYTAPVSTESARPTEPVAVAAEVPSKRSKALDAILAAAEAVVADAGPLTDDQRSKLASLLGGA